MARHAWLRKAVAALVAVVSITAIFLAIEIFLEQPMGLFSGPRPADLGFSGGQFKACPWKPNCVSSTAPATDEKHSIAPLQAQGNAWKKLHAVLAALPRVTVLADEPRYLRAEFKSARLGFVDDVEFALDDSGAIQVRSAARLGVRDFGVNRARVEDIRARIAAQPEL
jgi:uncharacterized protein (DUF1499 family)